VAIGAAYARAGHGGDEARGPQRGRGFLFLCAITGIEAGLVFVVADDPGMHSSQGEQDTRRFCQFARVPCLEPADSQEAKDMVAAGLELSEAFDTPVLIRTTTRVAHSHSAVAVGPDRPAPRGARPAYRLDPRKYVMVPANARARRPLMEERMARLAEYANDYALNRIEWGDRRLGIVAGGIAYQYAREVFPEASFLKLGMTYPLPGRRVAEFAAGVERLIVVEELDPIIEQEIKVQGLACEGKSIFPLIGELDQGIVHESAVRAGLLPPADVPRLAPALPDLPPRPPVLCPGCPHRGVFVAARKMKLVVNGDIGCYTLGAAQPLGAVHTTGCMGASIGVAHGVDRAGIQQSRVAVIGDSTFYHTGCRPCSTWPTTVATRPPSSWTTALRP
jgi:indolepyruvate ferredoxin oxidoreductase alpha subunit